MKSQPEPQPPGENVPPRLAGFLCERRDHITRRWIEAVRRNATLRTAATIDDKGLADHLPKLFDDLAGTLRGEPVADDAKHDAEAHGDHRWQQHYELEEVLEELGIVSRILLAHGLDAFADAHQETPPEQLRGARERILRFFEDAAAGSVRRYVQRSSEQLREQDLFLSEQRRLAADSAQRERTILESVTDRFFAFDADWRYTYLNDAAKRGMAPHIADPSALIGQNFFDVFPATRGTVIEQEYRRAVAEQTVTEFEVFYEPWERWYQSRCYPIPGGGLSVYFRDITEEKQAAQALATSEVKYRSLFDSIDTGFCVIEVLRDEHGEPVDYRYVEVNPAFAQQTGLTDAVGQRAYELIPNLEPRWAKIYGRVASTGVPTRFIEGAESMGRWFDVYAFRLGTDNGRLVAVLFSDITERRQAEETLHAARATLQESEARFRQLADAMPQIVWTARPDGVLDYTNQRWYEYIRRAESDWNVEDWHVRVHPDDIAGAGAVWAGCVASGEPYATEFRVQRGDGEYRWFLVRALAIREADGRIGRWYGTCTDIHEQRALLEQNAQLLDSERAARAAGRAAPAG